jgi:hypothetical protein
VRSPYQPLHRNRWGAEASQNAFACHHGVPPRGVRVPWACGGDQTVRFTWNRERRQLMRQRECTPHVGDGCSPVSWDAIPTYDYRQARPWVVRPRAGRHADPRSRATRRFRGDRTASLPPPGTGTYSSGTDYRHVGLEAVVHKDWTEKHCGGAAAEATAPPQGCLCSENAGCAT